MNHLGDDESGIEIRPGGFPTADIGSTFQQSGRLPPPTSPIIAESVPLPLAARSRARWRVAALALCLAQCRGLSATVLQLHVLTWAIQSPENFATLQRHWVGRVPGVSLRIWNPELEDSLRLATAAGIVEQTSNGRQRLTSDGSRLAQSLLESNEDALATERAMLKELGRISTAGMMRRLSGGAVTEGGN